MGLLSRLHQGSEALLGRVIPPNDLNGLLTASEAANAQRQAQLALGANLLQASGPSPVPIGTGQAVGGAIMSAQNTQNSLLDNAVKQRLALAQAQSLLNKNRNSIIPAGAAVLDENNRPIFLNPTTGGNKGQKIPTGYEEDPNNPGAIRPIPGGPYDASAHGNLSPEGMALAAARYRIDGTMPPLGRGSQATQQRTQIINMAAQQAAAEGNSAEASALQQVANKSNTIALGALVKQKNMVGSFEKTAQKNMDLVLELSKNVDRTGSPLVNRAIMNYKKNITGDPDTKAFVNALIAARTEYAKVLSGATGAQGVTDSARKEAEQLFATIDSDAALQKVIQTAKREMANRMASFDDQERELRATFTPPQGATMPEPTNTAPAQTQGTVPAPQQAVDYLMAHPELADQFKAKYGYLPEGL